MKNQGLKISGLLALLFVVASSFAQQLPLYSQYYFNKFIYNPALTGHSGNLEANLFGRNQYTQIDGYQTAGFSASGQANDGKIGLGLYLVNDANLLQTQNNVFANYAYNIKMSDANTLSLGFALGVVNTRFNTENFITTAPDDPTLRLLSTRPGAALDASIGANLKLSNFQLGVSVPQFLGSSQEFSDHQQSSLTYDLQNHLMVMTSYDIWANENLMIQPLILYKNTKNAPGQIDVNVIADWQNKGWLGAAWREGYGVTAMAGIRLAEKIRFGYSYDWSTGDYSQALGGSHEVLLGVSLNGLGGNKKASQEEMDALKSSLAEKHNQDLKNQDKKIEELEEKLAKVEKEKPRVDTVYVVQKAPKQPATPTPSQETKETPDNDPNVGDQKVSGEFIVVAGSFGEETNATIYFNQLVAKGFSPYMHYHRDTKVYYVHLGKFYFKEEARKFAKDNTKKGVKLWVKTLK